jgi:hypothetical protein
MFINTYVFTALPPAKQRRDSVQYDKSEIWRQAEKQKVDCTTKRATMQTYLP